MKFIKIQNTIFNAKSIVYIVQDGKTIWIQTEQDIRSFTYKNSDEAKVTLGAIWFELDMQGA